MIQPKYIVSAALLLTLALTPLATSRQTAQSSTALYDPELHLFADNSGIERTWQMSRVLGLPDRLPGPLVVPDKPWETGPHRMMFAYGGTGSVIFDPDYGKFRMWYGVITWTGDSQSDPPLMCYAESEDGIHWKKPSLGLIDYKGSKENNIVYSYLTDDNPPRRYQFAVFRDEVEKDPVKKYKGIGWIQATGFHVVTSPDGLRWSNKPKLVSTIGGDTFGITWDPIRKQYLMSGRGIVATKDELVNDKVAKAKRTVGIFESPTMDRWHYEGTGVELDEEDGFGHIAQHWAMNPFVYGSQYLGLLNVAVMRATGRTNRLELMSSHDGRAWQYVSRRETFLSEGPGGYWDGQMICLTGSPPIPAMKFTSITPYEPIFAPLVCRKSAAIASWVCTRGTVKWWQVTPTPSRANRSSRSGEIFGLLTY